MEILAQELHEISKEKGKKKLMGNEENLKLRH
jgi:hypothetical protein